MDFIHFLNGCTPHFKFTHEISDQNVAFLDTSVSFIDGNLVTDLYCKPTDSHNYLVYDSAHPQRCKDSIPYSQLLRIRRICSDVHDFDRHAIIFAAHFLKRGYPVKLLQEAATMARSKDRHLLLQESDSINEQKDRLFLITRYHPHDRCLPNIFHQNWNILGRSITTQHIQNKQLVCGFRRPKNLRDILVRAKVPYKPGDEEADPSHTCFSKTQETPTHPAPGRVSQKSITDFFTPSTTTPRDTGGTNTPSTTSKRLGTDPNKRGHSFCNHIQCRYCPLLNKTGTITSSVTDKEHKTMKNISCRSSNLIYAITCTKCNKQYVGQTSLRIKDRFVHHFRDISINNTEKTVGRHFSQRNHRGTNDMSITVLEFIRAPPRSPQASTIRNRVERNWTHTLRILAPAGLNMENPKELLKKQS